MNYIFVILLINILGQQFFNFIAIIDKSGFIWVVFLF